jgi:tryptophanyl-tRNA synthetase
MTDRKRIVSGMRATSPKLHLGNYEGALRPWIELQNQGHEVFSFVADWHVLTTKADRPEEIASNGREVVKDYIAAGLDPSRTTIFFQSHVKEHAELALLFGMVVGVGKLERNPTFKDAVQDIGDGFISFGLLGYPVLQAADIFLYKPYGVPVGKDQAPHLEVGNDIIRAFNSRFGDVFTEIVPIINLDESRSKLPGLDADEDGRIRKMSKSYDNCIYLNETEDETAARIKGAFTTPTKLRKTDPGVPEGCSVCQYLKLYSPNWEQQWAEDVAGERGCFQSKKELTESLNEFLRPMRERRKSLDDATVEDIIRKGAERAREVASATMDEVRRAMRLV